MRNETASGALMPLPPAPGMEDGMMETRQDVEHAAQKLCHEPAAAHAPAHAPTALQTVFGTEALLPTGGPQAALLTPGIS